MQKCYLISLGNGFLFNTVLKRDEQTGKQNYSNNVLGKEA